jgi:hypothetical protein
MARRKTLKVEKEIRQELGDTLGRLGFSPAKSLVTKLNQLEKEFDKRKDELSYRDIDSFYRLYINASIDLLPYIYGRRAVKHETKRLDAKINYNTMIEDLNKKAKSAQQLPPLSDIEIDADSYWTAVDDNADDESDDEWDEVN